MSTSTQLDAWAKARAPLQGQFLGFYSVNTLPHPREVARAVPCCLIVNYDPETLPGSHWVACLVFPNEVCWFDSYGLPPDAPDLIIGHKTLFRAWLRNICAHLSISVYEYNKADLKGWTAKTCGHWSLHFCKHGPSSGWGEFGPDRDKNDRRIRELVVLKDQAL